MVFVSVFCCISHMLVACAAGGEALSLHESLDEFFFRPVYRPIYNYDFNLKEPSA